MGKIILKPQPIGTPKKVRLPPLSEFHPAYKMDTRNSQAYVSVIFDTLPTKLDNKLLKKACEPMARKLNASVLWDSTYWTRRELTRNWDLARQQHCGSADEFSRHEAVRALEKFESEVFYKRLSKRVKALPTGGAWLTGKPKKSILFLDCACVLHNTGRPDIDSLIDEVVEELEIDSAIVALVKAYIAGPDDGDQYHEVCMDIRALVKPKPAKKKTAAKKAADKKVAAKKAAARNIAAGALARIACHKC